MTEMVTEYYLRPGYDFADEFEIGLRMILDAVTLMADEHGSQRGRL